MSRSITLVFACIVAVLAALAGAALTPAAAADDAARKQATATCTAQVKEQAHFHEMSWLARRRAVKKCVSDALAGH